MSKKINIGEIANELSSSVFFKRREEGAQERGDAEGISKTEKPQPEGNQPVRPVRTRVRRITQRYPFEFYQDQIETLRRLSAEERLQGGLGSMSAMVREAIDEFLEKRNRTSE